ncbi:MAG: SDR family NAD(P)-dependent oxidoreductase [Acidimicrobiales bacterium]
MPPAPAPRSPTTPARCRRAWRSPSTSAPRPTAPSRSSPRSPGERARADNFVYGSTKAGLDAFSQGLGDHLAGSGASVLVVRPGFVRTAMTEGMADGPMATTADAVARDIVAGLKRGAHTVWSPAKLRWVFAVLKVLPRPLWRKLAAAR